MQGEQTKGANAVLSQGVVNILNRDGKEGEEKKWHVLCASARSLGNKQKELETLID